MDTLIALDDHLFASFQPGGADRELLGRMTDDLYRVHAGEPVHRMSVLLVPQSPVIVSLMPGRCTDHAAPSWRSTVSRPEA